MNEYPSPFNPVMTPYVPFVQDRKNLFGYAWRRAVIESQGGNLCRVFMRGTMSPNRSRR